MTAHTYTESQVQILANIWRRRAAADRRDYGDMQANRIELCVDELLAMVPQINEALCYPARILELEECRKKGWNDSAPAYRAGWNDCCDSVASIIAPHSDVGALTEQADAWNAVVETLNKVSPGWQFNDAGTGLECACAEITALAERQAARSVVVSDEDVAITRYELDTEWDSGLGQYVPRQMVDSLDGEYVTYEDHVAALESFAQSHGVAGAVKVPKYRLMKAGDVVQITDEWLQDDGERWLPTTQLFVGLEYRRGEVLLPARRPLTDDAATQEKAS